MGRRLYLFTVNVNTGGESGIDLPGFIWKVGHSLSGYHNGIRIIHKFKVTGESKFIAVFDVSDVKGLDNMMAGLVRLGNIDISCKPVIPYEKFGSMLNVDETLTRPSTNCIADNFSGKSTEELLDTWKREAVAALGARNLGKCELYKVVAERKIHAFIMMEPEDLDILSFELPVMKENGNGVTISNHALQRLDD